MLQRTTRQSPTQDDKSSATQSSRQSVVAIIGPFIAIAAFILVTFVMIDESRLTPAQRMDLFAASKNYP